ncbi:DUF4920 domain-containing protein [Mucilaginibacter antarcticus]|uniref:DUF4920 domain-containing protein n=1 Tax=Mucilaginibacter antarcticus TaxID=1855725 RepID=A0ABW5XU15_9SPHI
MKKLALILLSLGCSLATLAQQSEIRPAKPGATYGKTISADNAINTAALKLALATDSVFTGKVTGKVVEVCTAKGCFMKLEQADGKTVMVQFKDYAYFMPKSIVGKNVVVEGKAKVKETSVERLQHFAKDAGKSEAEIGMIKAPQKDIGIMADGVLVVQ